ncbi:PD-(D/E)XK nuclease family protein [Curvibacter sp. APW13]|uniref:PD-(D/E)XK nuclease family protein n=1 Tax=Curvibacter sp. APW13 TaxID=3077236 RepID=UPI0028DF768E|nr:PD-(D/E)XK nuclease family protein [Curvibacter sp. APW13]MDT8992216.1 PD-(D/E)XK nuclease family protein [Curvibacter sp. APW13]
MAAIAKIHPVLGLPAPDILASHPVMAQWLAPSSGLLPRIQREMQQQGIHPGRCLVLLPFAHLRPLAQRLWQQFSPQGFAPRFETTRSWAAALGGQARGPFDWRADRGLDLLTAQSLLVQAGQAAQAQALAPHLVDAAAQLVGLAAGQAPEARASWAAGCRSSLAPGASVGTWEALVSQVALEWVALSAYTSDVLYEPAIWHAVDAVVQVGGLAPDPLGDGLAVHWGSARWIGLPWHEASSAEPQAAPLWCERVCRDALDEAQHSAACVLQHIRDGRTPLALVSSDRAFTRQVQSLLVAHGVQVRDETGWKLSTTRAGADVMALLRAAAWNASTDEVMAWLKLAPFAAHWCDALEARARRVSERDWSRAQKALVATGDDAFMAGLEALQAVRSGLQGRVSLTQWLARLRGGLQASGMWERLGPPPLDAPLAVEVWPEGEAVLACLQLDTAGLQRLQEASPGMAWAQAAWSLQEFTAWVSQSLEAASWSPPYPEQEQVVVVPLAQVLARPFAAVVLCGCDEVRLPASAAPAGVWTRAQREALGLPSREQLDAAQRQAWDAALLNAPVDVLWRASDESGEPLMAGAWVQALRMDVPSQPGSLVFGQRQLAAAPQCVPAPAGARLPIERLSASSYDDLRTCPYRFFALRLLGLKESDELDQDLDKRDFGVWLHEVLSRFHRQLLEQGDEAPQDRAGLLDDVALQVTRAQGLQDAEFLPYQASWPGVRDAYLDWLRGHEAKGYRFAQSELDCQRPWAGVTLQGRLDRLDRASDGHAHVIDYKTESSSRTRERVADAMEDTQMAFYGALLHGEDLQTLQGSYLALGEKDCLPFAQKDLPVAVQALLEGIAQDVQRIGAGAALPALGEGSACDYCQARGLCRKDVWGAVA